MLAERPADADTDEQVTAKVVVMHKGWEVHAAGNARADGRYEPDVAIVRVDDDVCFEHALDVAPMGAFDSASAAADHAMRFAMRYIDHNSD